MPANGRWDLIRRLKINLLNIIQGIIIPYLTPYYTVWHMSNAHRLLAKERPKLKDIVND